MPVKDKNTFSGFDDLIKLGKSKGHLTYEEINKHLPEEVTSKDMEKLLDELEARDIDVLDEAELTKDKKDKDSDSDGPSVEIEIEEEIKVFRLVDEVVVDELETGLKVKFCYQAKQEGNFLLSIEPLKSPAAEEGTVLVGEGQLVGLIDAQSVEIKINRAFMLDPGVSIDELEEGDLVAFTFRESGLQAIIESINAVDQPQEGDLMHGTFMGSIDGQSIEIEYFQAFALGEDVSLDEIKDGEDIVFTYCEGEYRPLIVSVSSK